MAQFAKVASDLDSNPKIRKAGRNGREVFLFVLRRNAALDLGGRVPKTHVEGWYLAEQLMMSEDEAMSGLSQCVRTGLLSDQDDDFFIVGWDDEFAKRPLTEAERKAKQRAKSKPSAVESGHVTTMSGQESDCPDSHAREEKRREEKKEDVSGKPDDPARAFAEKAIALINTHAGTKYRPSSEAVLKLCRALIRNKHTLEQAEKVIVSKRAWVGDPKMGQYFRPATLLAATNFATYLDDLSARPTQPSFSLAQNCNREEAVHPLMLAFADAGGDS